MSLVKEGEKRPEGRKKNGEEIRVGMRKCRGAGGNCRIDLAFRSGD